MTGKGTKRRTVRIDDELWGRIVAYAEMTGRNASDVIREAAALYVLGTENDGSNR